MVKALERTLFFNSWLAKLAWWIKGGFTGKAHERTRYAKRGRLEWVIPWRGRQAQEGIGRWVPDVTVLPRYGFTAGARP
jgi:hypothetical protein